MNHFKDNLMQQKSYMNWQVAFCLAVFITLMCVLPLFSPLYLKMMGGDRKSTRLNSSHVT